MHGTWLRLVVGMMLVTGMMTGYARAQPVAAHIGLKSLHLYDSAHFDYVDCQIEGGPTTTVANSSTEVYYLALWKNHSGKHTFGTSWYAPGGKLFASYTFHDQNVDASCGGLTILGTKAGTHLGMWTLKLLVDGHVRGTTRFSMERGETDGSPTIRIPCDFQGCATNLQGVGPADGTTSATLVFPGPASFKLYVLWSCYSGQSPGMRVDLIGDDNRTPTSLAGNGTPTGSQTVLESSAVRGSVDRGLAFTGAHLWALRIQTRCAWNVEAV